MKKVISVFITFFIIVFCIMFLAIENSESNIDKSTDKVKVIATLFPQYDFVRQIGKDKVEVSLLLPSGTEAHTYDPTPKDIININESDLFVYTGSNMEPWAETISTSIENRVKILDVSKNIEYIKEEHEHVASGEHEYHQEHEYDPHIWLDISNAEKMVDNILEALIEIDPENINYYTKNAEIYKEKLDNLDEEFFEVINNSKRNIVCFGDKFAYMYFITRYGLDYITAYDSCSANSEPSVSKILEIENKIIKENIPVIFYESLSEGTIAKSIANDTGINALVFSSVHTVSSNDIRDGATYISVMRENLNNLKMALN